MAYQSQDIIRRSATNGLTPAPEPDDDQKLRCELCHVAASLNALPYTT